MKIRIVLIGILLASVAAVAPLLVHAATTAPQKIIYNGHLLNSDGDAITTAHSIRFSYWSSTDYDSGDVSGGDIVTTADNYADWQEVHTVTPNTQGYFTVELGSVTSLPNFATMTASTLLSLHLQVEVKVSTAANTAYELLDIDSSDDAVDRAPVRSVPFALNADLIDQREPGSGSGDLVFLGSGGNLFQAGTLADRFTIDADGSSGALALRFGKTFKKELSWDNANTWFNFNDDVNIQGDITLSGLINGINISTLASDNDVHLKVSSGASLKIDVAAGDYRLSGNVTEYAGTSNISVTDEATNYVFFGSGGLTVRTNSFPTDESHIRLAEVVTSGGAITSVSDRRVFNADDRERTISNTFAPLYEGAAYYADGSNNVGQLKVVSSGSAITNHYTWTSTRTTLQDYDIVLHATVSDEFVRFSDTPMSLTYRTTNSNSDSVQIDVQVFDTAGTEVTLTNAADLNNTDWTTTNIGFSGSPTWTVGSGFLIKVRPFAKDNEEAQIGHIKLQYIELPAE